MNFLYRVEQDTAFPTEYTAGPWGTELQHGGAPTALISWAAERIPTREPMQVVRITVDLLRPVPIAPLQIRTEVLREGRKIQLCAVTLLHENVVVVRATVLKIRRAELELPPTAVEEASRRCPDRTPGNRRDTPNENPNAFIRGLTLRVVQGQFRAPGPAAIWFRVDRPLFEGQAPTPLQRVAMIADFCNGVSTRAGLSLVDVHQRRPDDQPGAPAGRRLDPARRADLARRPRLRHRVREARRQPRLLRPRDPEPGDRAAR